MMFTGADQIGAPHALQRLAQQRPVVGVVIAQEGLVQPALPIPLGMVTASLADASMRFSGFLPQWYMAVAVAIGEGRKACT